jgi:hypothetical protein
VTVSTSSFPTRWTVANTLALLFGYVLYTPIAHGITGAHPQGMDARQVFAHSVALAVVAASLAAAQRHVLKPYVVVPWTRIPVAVVGFVALFFAGSYQPWLTGPDWDILFGSLVLGSAMFVGVVPARGHRLAATVATLSFPFASFAGQVLIAAVVIGWFRVVPDLQTSQLQHSAYWIGVGLAMGVVGGWIGGLALQRMLTGSRVGHALR